MKQLKHISKVENGSLVCSSPKINKIWEWGGGTGLREDSPWVHKVSIILNNMERVDFTVNEGDDEGILYKKVDDYINNL